eukprot:scaffold1670_cov370-Prasinococcus_capsulatus_cf.AAC.5
MEVAVFEVAAPVVRGVLHQVESPSFAGLEPLQVRHVARKVLRDVVALLKERRAGAFNSHRGGLVLGAPESGVTSSPARARAAICLAQAGPAIGLETCARGAREHACDLLARALEARFRHARGDAAVLALQACGHLINLSVQSARLRGDERELRARRPRRRPPPPRRPRRPPRRRAGPRAVRRGPWSGSPREGRRAGRRRSRAGSAGSGRSATARSTPRTTWRRATARRATGRRTRTSRRTECPARGSPRSRPQASEEGGSCRAASSGKAVGGWRPCGALLTRAALPAPPPPPPLLLLLLAVHRTTPGSGSGPPA